LSLSGEFAEKPASFCPKQVNFYWKFVSDEGKATVSMKNLLSLMKLPVNAKIITVIPPGKSAYH
jgi:hypothetical protein